VGWGLGSATGNYEHALLWNGTAASVVDLHPAGFSDSNATAVSGAGQVGYGYSEGSNHAFLWSGTAASALDLHPFLSDLGPVFTDSTATAIDDNGTIVGIATDADFHDYAVMWTPVPESGVQGDYNNDAVVDAGDFVVWRKYNGTSFHLTKAGLRHPAQCQNRMEQF
jgi:hypothetical protein